MGLSKILAIFSIISVALASLNSVPAIVWTNNKFVYFLYPLHVLNVRN